MFNGEATKLLVYTVGAFIYILLKLHSGSQYYHRVEMNNKLVGLDFEVYGRVQGVFFRKVSGKGLFVIRRVRLADRVTSSFIGTLVSNRWLHCGDLYVCFGTGVVKVALFYTTLRVAGICKLKAYTQERGRKLGLKGWCMNTERGTVVGRLEGDKTKIEDMKRWLQYTGSPQSSIEKAEFRNEKDITKIELSDFKIKK